MTKCIYYIQSNEIYSKQPVNLEAAEAHNGRRGEQGDEQEGQRENRRGVQDEIERCWVRFHRAEQQRHAQADQDVENGSAVASCNGHLAQTLNDREAENGSG